MKLIALAPNMMVKNVEETLKFYQKIGFEIINTVKDKEGVPQWAMVQTGNVRLMFQEQENLAKEISPMKGMNIGATLNFYISVEGIQELFNSIKGSTKIVNQLTKTFYGVNEFTIQDLNGYFITFAEHADD